MSYSFFLQSKGLSINIPTVKSHNNVSHIFQKVHEQTIARLPH